MKQTVDSGSPGQGRFSDADISHRVTSYLCYQGLGDIAQLDVEVHDGVVTLSGVVQDGQEKQVAVNACQRVAGVLHLIDQLQVQRGV